MQALIHEKILKQTKSFTFQINTNGFIATTQPSTESTYLSKMPAPFGMIAALQGDLDTSDGVGKVFFRQDNSPAILQQAADYINRAFPEDDEVNPTNVVVITWVDVAAHNDQNRGDGIDKGVRLYIKGHFELQLFTRVL